MSIPLPSRIGKYQLLEFLGGGMAEVYKSQDSILGRTVALKILSPIGNNDPDTRARFLQEARMASSVIHDNIMSVYDFGEEQGRPFMVMEFLVGQSLRDVIQKGEAGDLSQRLSYALQIACALGYIHQKKIIHRDVKPDNVHVDGAGRVKLMDFGIAKAEGAALTRAGFTLGTPYYMAPEQVMGQPATPLVDIYAFGILMFELFTGVKPIQDKNIQVIFQRILHEPISMQPLQELGIPSRVIKLVEKCVAKNPADRWQDFESLVDELTRIQQGDTPIASQGAVTLPGALNKLPAGMRTQGGLILISMLGMLLVLSIVVVLLRTFHLL